MANTIEKVALIQKTLDQAMIQGAVTGFMEDNVQNVIYRGGNEVKIPKIDMDGLANYDRTSGFADGDVTLVYQTMTMTQDRGRGFTVDPMEIDESGILDLMSQLAGEFQRTKVVPEVDAYRISRIVALAGAAGAACIAGTAYMAGISSGFNGAKTVLAADAATVAGAAASAAQSALSYTAGYTTGSNMVAGMASGVRAGANGLYSAITAVANAAVRRAKSALRINSPSGVFADEVGAWIPGGIGKGVLTHLGDALGPLDQVRRSMVGLMTGALDGVNPGMSGIPWNVGGSGETTVNINVTGDWTVRSEQDKQEIIDAIFERIDEERRRR